MRIDSLQIEYAEKGCNSSNTIDSVCHVKTLPYLSIVQSVEGSYSITIANNNTFKTKSGGFFLAPADIQQTIVHHADTDTKNMTFRWLFIKYKINDLYSFDELYSLPVILPEELNDQLNEIFNQLFDSDNIFKQYVCYFKIAEILSKVAILKDNYPDKYISEALLFIKENFSRKITVDELANVVNLSSSRFYSVFKNAFGVSPIAYINNYRLSVAANMLISTNKTITEIAYSVGIEDSVYFNKMFKKAYQLSPTQYRKTYATDK